MASLELPESLVYKDRIIFGNIEDLYVFHSKWVVHSIVLH